MHERLRGHPDSERDDDSGKRERDRVRDPRVAAIANDAPVVHHHQQEAQNDRQDETVERFDVHRDLHERQVRHEYDAIVRARLADFIHDAFTVDKAHDEALYLRNKTYAAIPQNSQAFQAMTDWYEKDDSKFDSSLKGFKAWVEAQPIATFALPAPDTYQIDFTMTVHANNDQNKIISKWRAILHVIAGHSNNPESGAMFVDNIDLERE